MEELGTGAQPSKFDSRDHKHDTQALARPFPETYETDISHLAMRMQGKLGVCTAEALAKYIEHLYYKKTGVYVKLSTAFLYIATKKYVDRNTIEGSSLRSALKAAAKYGICTEATFPTNYSLSHADFIAQELPQEALWEALKYKGGRYFQVPIEEDLLKAHIYEYDMLYVRFDLGKEWFTPSWLASDILPLKPPAVTISGHANVLFGYLKDSFFKNSNSWSERWADKGNGHFYLNEYGEHLTEAWVVTLDEVTPDNSPRISQRVVAQLINTLKLFGLWYN